VCASAHICYYFIKFREALSGVARLLAGCHIG
jgi:hypothetical protein